MRCPFSGYYNPNLCFDEIAIAFLFTFTLLLLCFLIYFVADRRYKKEQEMLKSKKHSKNVLNSKKPEVFHNGRKRTKKADKAVRTHGD
jgi:hypothetical protein